MNNLTSPCVVCSEFRDIGYVAVDGSGSTNSKDVRMNGKNNIARSVVASKILSDYGIKRSERLSNSSAATVSNAILNALKAASKKSETRITKQVSVFIINDSEDNGSGKWNSIISYKNDPKNNLTDISLNVYFLRISGKEFTGAPYNEMMALKNTAPEWVKSFIVMSTNNYDTNGNAEINNLLSLAVTKGFICVGKTGRSETFPASAASNAKALEQLLISQGYCAESPTPTPTPTKTPTPTPTKTRPVSTPTPTPTPTKTRPVSTPTPTPTTTPTGAVSTGSCRWIQLGQDIDGEAAQDQSGRSVSMNGAGDRIIIGAPRNDGNGSNSGSARVYSYNGASWVKLGQDIDGKDTNDYFGTCVSMNNAGDRVAIGAPYDHANGFNSGSVGIYSYNGTSWTQLGQYINGQVTYGNEGASICMNSSGDRVVVGAVYSGNSGYVKVYSYNGVDWVQTGQTIAWKPVDTGSGIGSSVSINGAGDIIAIGAPSNNSPEVRIYSYDGNEWIQMGETFFGHNLGASGFSFGSSVTLSDSGNVVAIGTPYDIDWTLNALRGKVRVYSYNGTSWNQLGETITEKVDGGMMEGPGISINGAGDTIVIGGAASGTAGGVEVYRYDGTSWSQLCQDIKGEASGDASGTSVFINIAGDRVAVGAPGNKGNNKTGSGHVRVYSLSNETLPSTSTPTPTPTPTKTRPVSTPTPTPTRPKSIPPVSRQLFNKQSFAGKVPTKYSTALNRAVDRWSKYIKLNPAVHDSLKSFVAANLGITNWNGISLSRCIIFNENSGRIAYCRPLLPLSYGPNSKFTASVSFELGINTKFDSYTTQQWYDIISHELGHALGIGGYWTSQNDFLDGSEYTQTQSAYNSIVGNNSFVKTPLESTGDSGTASAHWEDNFRLGSTPGANGVSYPGIYGELMNGYYNPTAPSLKITKLTINALKEFGYEEVTPGASEGMPNVASSLQTSSLSVSGENNTIRLDCGCGSEKVERIALPLNFS